MPGETSLDSDTEGTYGAYVDALGKYGLLYVHAIEGVTQKSRDTDDLDFDKLRHRFAGTYIANNKLTLDIAEKELASGHADLFSFGRPYIANPDLVERMRAGGPIADPPQACLYGGDFHGYSDWPGMDGKIILK